MKHAAAALLLVYFLAGFHSILFTTNGVFERDGYYHARYAQMLPERGLSREFQWMQFTTWKTQFADKDVLYHVILAPFCRNAADPLPGAKWATLFLGATAYIAFYLLLLRLRVPATWFWTVLLIVGSGLFLNRMLMIRSHLLSVLLMIPSTYFILKERVRWCFAMGFIYSWSYSFPLAIVLTALAAATGRLCFGERSWRVFKIPGAAAAGVAAGLVIHPYSPHSITSVWMFLNISSSRAAGIPLELGSEFRPLFSISAFDSAQAFLNSVISMCVEIPGPLMALILAVVLALRLRMGKLKDRTLSTESAAAVGIAAGWFASMFVFSRLIEYFAPMSALAAALVCRDALDPAWIASRPSRKVWLSGAAVLLLGGLHWLSFEECSEIVNSTRPHRPAQIFISDDQWRDGRFFANSTDGGAVKWLRDHVPAHSTIINFHWDDFPELFYEAPDYNYLVGLDPTFMRLPYPEHSATLESMRTGQIPLDFARFHQLFGADYLIMRNTRAAVYPELRSRKIAPVYADEGAVIYKIE